MTPTYDHICACICTYKRPTLLAKLLGELQTQVTNGLFTYSIVVVDNDYAHTAKGTVEAYKRKSVLSIDYYSEAEQNIALARNKAVDNARGNFIAFIDDDEFPTSTWLLNLYKAYTKFNADGILGPVKPHFDGKPPNWLIKGKFCERKSHKTGTVLHWWQTRTGNVLFNKNIFEDKNNRFGPEFGRSGGEDIEFFKKIMISDGRVFIWCNEALVYETVPPERWEKSYYIKKFLRIGGLSGEKTRKTPDLMYLLIKVVIAFILYMVALPFSLLLGKHIYVKCLIKVAYNFSWLAGFCGYVIIRNKDD